MRLLAIINTIVKDVKESEVKDILSDLHNFASEHKLGVVGRQSIWGYKAISCESSLLYPLES